MVYVINKDGYPLMPTERHGKVRRLLRDNQAVVIKERRVAIPPQPTEDGVSSLNS